MWSKITVFNIKQNAHCLNGFIFARAKCRSSTSSSSTQAVYSGSEFHSSSEFMLKRSPSIIGNAKMNVPKCFVGGAHCLNIRGSCKPVTLDSWLTANKITSLGAVVQTDFA